MPIPRPRLSLRVRLFLLAIIALAPALAILGYNEIALRRSREAEVHALALRLGQAVSLEMQGILEGAEGLLLAIAHVPAVRAFDGEGCQAYLAEVQDESPHLTAITVVDRQGSIRCRTDRMGQGLRLDDRPYFRYVIETGRFVVGEYTISRVSGRPALPLAVPIKDGAGAVTGVVVAGLNLDWLGDRLRHRDFARGSAITIADHNGVIIAREPYPERFIGTRIPEAFQRLVHATAPGTEELTSQDGTRRVQGYFPVPAMPEGLYVSAGISLDEAFGPIDRATRRGIMLALVGAMIAFGAAWLFGRHFIRRPVERVVAAIEAWRAGNLQARTAMAAESGELESVGAAVDRLMDELAIRQAERERAEERQRLLLHELTHRVKNILATVQFVARQTLRADVTPEDAQTALQARLMALAGAHDVLTRENWEGASLRDVVTQAVAPFNDPNGTRLRMTGPEVRVSAQTALALAMAFQELATNAVKYGALSNEAGTVRIAWLTAEGAGADRKLTIRWEEAGGPPVRPPSRRGFGSRLLERALAQDLDGGVSIDFVATGIVCTVETKAA